MITRRPKPRKAASASGAESFSGSETASKPAGLPLDADIQDRLRPRANSVGRRIERRQTLDAVLGQQRSPADNERGRGP